MSSDIYNDCLINGVKYKCRTCFDPGRIIHSLTEEASKAKTWHEVLKDIARIQTNDDELLPKTLCSKCLEKLKTSYDFVLQIQKVDKKYSELLANDGVRNEVDNFSDCLAESAITLPLDQQYMPDIKLEEEMVVSYDINMDNNKLEEDGEMKFENEDTNDPFTETFDTDYNTEQLEQIESEIAITGKRTAKRNRRKKVKENVQLFRNTAKRTKKTKQPKDIEKTSRTDEIRNTDDNDVKETIVCGKCSQTFFTKHTYQKHQQEEHFSDEANDERNKCPICSKEFRNRFYVVDHIKVVHDKLKPFKCSHCTKCFASAGAKKIHELTHIDNFPYVCEYCDKRFRLASKLKIHSEIHTTKPELLCPICKRSQKSQEELEAHVKNHDDNRLQCPCCGHLFRKRSNFNDHYNAVHLKLRPYKCEICELSFGDRKTRRVHQRSHRNKDTSISAKAKSGKKTTKRNRGKKVKQSGESEEIFRSPVKRSKKSQQPKKTVKTAHTDELLNETKNINEDDDAKETIVCDKCSQTFPTIHTYQRHQQAEHSSESNEEKNKCPICSKEFRNSWYVVDHIKVVHDKLKPYNCSHCPKSFASAHSKRIHELTHTDNFPYACEYCDRRFRLSSKLKIHSEIHTTKPELLCPICKRSQKSQEELEVHVKNHDDNRLQCPSCGNLFRRNAQLKDHYNAVHLKLRPYKCEFCELGFGDRKTRRVHQRTHHKQELSITSPNVSLDDDCNDSDYENESRSSSSNESDNEAPCSSSSLNGGEKEGTSGQPLQQRTRGGPHPEDDVIEQFKNCFRCLLCKKKLTLLRNCRRHVATLHFREINVTRKSSAEKINQNLLKKPNEIYSDKFIYTNTPDLSFGDRIYSKPSTWRLVECKLCNITFESCKALRQHLENHDDMDTLHSLKLSDNIVQNLFPNMIHLKFIKESICGDIRKKHWFKYYTVLNQYSYEMSVSDTEVDELEDENPERAGKYKCAFCAKGFAYKYHVFPHLKQAHSEQGFKCDRCKLQFVSIKMYKQHLQTHCNNQHKTLLCGNCPGKFVWPENIKNHICPAGIPVTTAAGLDDRLVCIVIDNKLDPERRQTSSPATLDEQLTCNVILRKSANQKSAPDLQDQIKYNVNDRKYDPDIITMRCGLCEQSFQKLRHLRQHMPLHADGKTGIDFQNCIYVKEFGSSISIDILEQQIKNDYRKGQISNFYQAIDKYGDEMDISDSDSDSDTENIEKEYGCEVCKEMFKKRKYLLWHQQERHNSMQLPFTCPTFARNCGKQYVSIHLLHQHLKKECWNVKRKKAPQCEICNDRFIWPSNLLKHKIMQHDITRESSNLPTISFVGSGTSASAVVTTPPAYNEAVSTSKYFQTVCQQPTPATETKFVCSYCYVSFSNNSKLLLHTLKRHTDEETFKCSFCEMTFVRATDLQSHNLTHAGELPFKCMFCEKSFLQEVQLNSHKNYCESMGHTETHVNDKHHKCEFCEMAFISESYLQNHRRTHIKECPHKCQHCEKSFPTKDKLKEHIRTHTGERPYQCTFCSKAFNVSGQLKLHMSIHTGEKPFQCDICCKTFARSAYLKAHRETMGHNDLWSTPDNISNSEGLENMATSKSKRNLCPICGIHLSRTTSFTHHMRTHTGDRPHKCEFCEKGFISRTHLRHHRRIHTKERPHKCPHCQKSFPTKQRLIKHIRIHTGERPYRCTFCSKAFNVPEALKLHLRIHTGEKPFKCNVCNQAYANNAYLKKHRIAKGHVVEKKII